MEKAYFHHTFIHQVHFFEKEFQIIFCKVVFVRVTFDDKPPTYNSSHYKYLCSVVPIGNPSTYYFICNVSVCLSTLPSIGSQRSTVSSDWPTQQDVKTL